MLTIFNGVKVFGWDILTTPEFNMHSGCIQSRHFYTNCLFKTLNYCKLVYNLAIWEFTPRAAWSVSNRKKFILIETAGGNLPVDLCWVAVIVFKMLLRNYKILCNIISGCRGPSFPKLLHFYHINLFLSPPLFIYKYLIYEKKYFSWQWQHY